MVDSYTSFEWEVWERFINSVSLMSFIGLSIFCAGHNLCEGRERERAAKNGLKFKSLIIIVFFILCKNISQVIKHFKRCFKWNYYFTKQGWLRPVCKASFLRKKVFYCGSIKTHDFYQWPTEWFSIWTHMTILTCFDVQHGNFFTIFVQ